jgi:NitT/TauT family transport system permease protein
MKEFTYKNNPLIYGSTVLILVLWFVGAKVLGNEVIIPSPEGTIKSLFHIVREEKFFTVVGTTLLRSLISFSISLLLALLVGVLGSFNKYIYNFMIPIIIILKSVPTMAFIVMALIWFSKDGAPILVGFIISFPILYENVMNATINVDSKLLEMAYLYDLRRRDLIANIYLPSIFFSLMNIFTSTFSLTMKVVIGGEVLGQPTYGIGGALQLEKTYLNTSAVFGWIIVVALISLIFDGIQKVINRKIFRWRG